MTLKASRLAEVCTVRAVPRVAAQLRRIALHEETAALLEVRATRAGADHLASPLQRRAAEHRREAQQLRTELAAEIGSERRGPGGAVAGGDSAAS